MPSKKVSKDISTPEVEPRRIYGWLDSQLSIARYYGGIMMDGVEYRIDYAAEGQPLVEVITPMRAKRAKRKNPPADPLGDLMAGL